MTFFRMATMLMLLTAGLVLAAEKEEGDTSYYADSLDGNKAAGGQPYDKSAFTAGISNKRAR